MICFLHVESTRVIYSDDVGNLGLLNRVSWNLSFLGVEFTKEVELHAKSF